MRRNAFDPTPELREIRETAGVRTVTNSFGMDGLSRHQIRGRQGRAVRPRSGSPTAGHRGSSCPGHRRFRRGAGQRAGGQSARPRPSGAPAAAPHAHPRVHHPPDEAAGTAHRRDRRSAPRCDGNRRAASRFGGELRAADPVAGDLRVARSALRRPRRLPAAQRTPARSVHSDRRTHRPAAAGPRLHADPGRACAHGTPARTFSGCWSASTAPSCTDDELIGVAGLLLLAGHETTSNMLGLGTLALLRHPEQLAAVRDDPDAVGPAIEELLRWLSIVHSAIPRITTTEVEVAGRADSGGSTRVRVAAVGQSGSRTSSTPRRYSTSAAAHRGISPSATACTTAWAPRWRGWRCGSRSPRCCAASPRLALAEDFDDVQFRSFHFIYGLKSLEVTGMDDMKVHSRPRGVHSGGQLRDGRRRGLRSGRRRHRGGACRRDAGRRGDHAREAVKLCPSQALQSDCRLVLVAVESMTPARINSSTLTTSTHTGKAIVSHMLTSADRMSPTATR